MPAPSVQPATPRVAQPPTPDFDYDRLAGMVAQRMQPAAVAAVARPAADAPVAAVPNANDMTAFLTAYSTSVRENERGRIKAEREEANKATLAAKTKQYFGRLPPPMSGGDPWDQCFSPR